MGVAKAVYVKDADLELWAKAEEYARAHRLTMSALVLTAMEQFLAAREEPSS